MSAPAGRFPLAVLCVLGLLGLVVGTLGAIVTERLVAADQEPACPACGAERGGGAGAAIGTVLRLVLLRSRRCCGAAARLADAAVPWSTATLFVLLGLRFGTTVALPAFLYLAATGVPLAAIDLRVRRLPDVLTLPAYPVGVGLLALGPLAGAPARPLLRGVLGMAALFVLYFLLALVSPGGLGFGDVKLAGVLGLYLGWLSWSAWLWGAAAGFVLGGAVAAVLVVLGRAQRRTALPFGPFMLLGALLVILLDAR